MPFLEECQNLLARHYTDFSAEKLRGQDYIKKSALINAIEYSVVQVAAVTFVCQSVSKCSLKTASKLG